MRWRQEEEKEETADGNTRHLLLVAVCTIPCQKLRQDSEKDIANDERPLARAAL